MLLIQALVLFSVVVAAQQQLIAAPNQIKIPNPRPRNLTYDVNPSFTGGLSTVAVGMQPARVFPGTISDAELPAAIMPVTVPPGRWTFLRFALFSNDVSYSGSPPDLNLGVFLPTGELIGASRNEGNDEYVDIFMPTSTSYIVGVFDASDTSSKPVDFKLSMWMLTQPGPASSFFKSAPPFNRPAPATTGTNVPVTLTFSDRVRSPAQNWLGFVGYKAHLNNSVVQQEEVTLVWLIPSEPETINP